MICIFNELNVKKGQQTCTCFYEQIDCACKTNFPDYIIGIYDVKKKGHLQKYDLQIRIQPSDTLLKVLRL